MNPRTSQLLDRLRRLGPTLLLPAALIAVTAVVGWSLHQHYAIKNWLVWTYVSNWLCCALFAGACLSAGHQILRRILGRTLPLREHVVMAFATGLLVFFGGVFVGGLLHLYGTAFFFAWPLAMLAIGARSTLQTSIRAFRLLRRARRTARAPSVLRSLVTAFGLAGVGMVYFLILSPDNVAYDAQWYHLSIAEHYVAQGGVAAFPEGWFQGALPHLASFIYTWGFQLPMGRTFDRIELCAHLEFTIFLFTLASIPVLVRWAAPGSRARGAWAALFLFPGILLYDSSLSVAADHIAAFWAIPIFLSLRRAFATLSPRECAVLGAMLAGAMCTKYQAMTIIAFPIAALTLRTVWLAWRGRRSLRQSARTLLGPVAAALSALVCTAPHWLKNWIWYGDPVYPFLYKHLSVHPWNPDAPNLFESFFKGVQMWRPSGTTFEQLIETTKALFTFAFVPHDWEHLHHDVPVFGFLFTCTMVAIPFVRRRARLVALTVASLTGVFIWYWTSHQDRYLQVLLPWLVVSTAATVTMVWKTGWPGRVALSLLVALQIVWGGDIYFFPTHPMLHGTPIKSVVDLMSSGFRGDLEARSRVYGPMSDVADVLPRGSKVLVHELQPHLGLRAMSVSDAQAWQGGISYGRVESPRALQEQLRSYGVTHLLWHTKVSDDFDSLAGDLVFWEFATKYATNPKPFGHLTLAGLPIARLPDRRWLDEKVAIVGCADWYPSGIYRVGDVTVPMHGVKPPWPKALSPLRPDQLVGVAAQVSFVAFDPQCASGPPREINNDFELMALRHKLQLWTRRK